MRSSGKMRRYCGIDAFDQHDSIVEPGTSTVPFPAPDNGELFSLEAECMLNMNQFIGINPHQEQFEWIY